MQKTVSYKKDDVERKWYVIDLENQVLGRTASKIATILRGKHKPQFTPHNDTGDFVVVVNASKVLLTGKKKQQKKYYSHSGYIGNLKTRTAAEMLEKKPEELVRLAVRGMMPHNTLGRAQLKKLKIYAGAEHPHQAQQPTALDPTASVWEKK